MLNKGCEKTRSREIFFLGRGQNRVSVSFLLVTKNDIDGAGIIFSLTMFVVIECETRSRDVAEHSYDRARIEHFGRERDRERTHREDEIEYEEQVFDHSHSAPHLGQLSRVVQR